MQVDKDTISNKLYIKRNVFGFLIIN